MEKEIWKVIPFAEKYEVSNLGRVRNIKSGRFIKPIVTPSHKQPQVFLTTNNKLFDRIQITLAQIVYNMFCVKDGKHWTWLWFNGYKIKGNRIGHHNGNKFDCRAENLYAY